MEELGDILKRLAASRPETNGEMAGRYPEAETAPACDTCGGRGWFTRDVPVGHPEFGAVAPCDCQRENVEEERSRRLLRYSNLGHLTRFTFDSLRPEGRGANPEDHRLFGLAYEAATAFSDNPAGWLAFTGPHGSGKTHLAAAIANRCIERGHVAFFVHVPDLLDHLRASFAPSSEISYSDLFDQVRNTPLLVLDGLGSHASTPWALEKLQQIFNHRYGGDLPTVVTTACELDELDPYLRSRLQTEGLSRVFPVQSRDAGRASRIGRIPDELLRRMTFDAFDVRGNSPTSKQRSSLEGALRFAKNYAADPHGWVTLSGETGVGKTHLAVAIAVEQMKQGHPVMFAFVPDLLDHLRQTYSRDSRVTYDAAFDEIKNAPLLILDDLRELDPTVWAFEKLYQIVVYRHNAGLPTVITSTIDFPDRHEHSGPISSRVRDTSIGELLVIDAPDYRSKESSRRGSTRRAPERRRGAQR